MKLPKTFLPDKNLEGKVENLKSQKKSRINSLNDLVLWRDSEEFMMCNALLMSDIEKEYSYLNSDSICGGYCVKYDDVVLHILEFVDPSCVRDNKKALNKCLDSYNSKTKYSDRCLVIKDNYAVFIHTYLGDCNNRSKFISTYRKMFGFKELK